MKKYLPAIFIALLVLSLITGCAKRSGTQAVYDASKGTQDDFTSDMSDGAQTVSNQDVSVKIPASFPEKNKVQDVSFTGEEYKKIADFKFDNYEDMSISEYQNKVWLLADKPEYGNVLRHFAENETFYECRDSDDTAFYLFYILEPLTGDNWQTRDYGGFAKSDCPGCADEAMFEFTVTLTILDKDTLTVGEYNTARAGITGSLQSILQNKTPEQLQDAARMRTELDEEIGGLTKKWGGKIDITVEYVYTPLSTPETEEQTESTCEDEEYAKSICEDEKQTESICEDEEYAENICEDGEHAKNTCEDEERRKYPNAAKEDYESLLALKTPDYQSSSLADFNEALLEWGNENYERYERINCDTVYNDFAVPLTEEERRFVTLSVNFSGMENAKHIQSSYTGKPEEAVTYARYLPQKISEKGGRSAWCDLYYQFSYQIADKEAITVGERDRILEEMMNAVQEFWEKSDIEAVLKMEEGEIVRELQKAADSCSTEKLEIIITEEQVAFEKMDERQID